MPLPQAPFRSRSLAFTSIATAQKFSPPIGWIYVVNAGNVVVKDEAGNASTFASCSAGEVLVGPFSEITSMTSTSIRAGDGPIPQSEIAGVESSSATSLTTRISTEESVDASLASTNLSKTVSADTSLTSRLSTADSTITSQASTNLSQTVSADTSLYSRLSTADSTLTSGVTSLTTRVSVAESVEASKG